MYITQLRERVSSPSQNTVGVFNQITLLILYYISSRLVTLLKIIDAPIQDTIKLLCEDITNFCVQIRDKAAKLETEYVIFGCLVTALHNLVEFMHECGTVMEW
jgi:hypothetical protein